METQRIRLEDLFQRFSDGVAESLWHAQRDGCLMELLFGPHRSPGWAESLKATQAWRIVEAAYGYGMEGVPPHPDPVTQEAFESGFLLVQKALYGMASSLEWKTVAASCAAHRRLDGGAELDVEELALLAMVGRRTVLDAINCGTLVAREKGEHMNLVISPSSASDWLLRCTDFKPTRARDAAPSSQGRRARATSEGRSSVRGNGR